MAKCCLTAGVLTVLIGFAICQVEQDLRTDSESTTPGGITVLPDQHSKAEYVVELVEPDEQSEAPEVVTLATEKAEKSAEIPEGATDTRPSDRTADWSTGSSWNVYIIMGIFVLTNTIKLIPVGIAEIFKYKEAKANAATAELNHVDSIESVVGPNLDEKISSVRLPSVDTSMTDLSSIDKDSIK